MAMLQTLSDEEVVAVTVYDRMIEYGEIPSGPLLFAPFPAQLFIDGQPGPTGKIDILDVGCGIGRMCQLAFQLGAQRYYGIDPSELSIAYARAVFAEDIMRERVRFEIGEIRELGYSYPNQFSGFLCIDVLKHLPRNHLTRALTSLRGSLVPGAKGLLTFSTAGQYLAGIDRRQIPFNYFSKSEVADALRMSGFDIAMMGKDLKQSSTYEDIVQVCAVAV